MTLAQYAAGDLRIVLDDGGVLALRVTTDYPHDGRVRVEVTQAPERPVTLRMRVPHWADGATLTGPDGSTRAVGPGWAESVPQSDPPTDSPGQVRRVSRPVRDPLGSVPEQALAVGDVVTLDLPVAPRLTWPDPRVDAVRGTVAVERGPLVLALESVDLPDGVALDHVRLDPEVAPRAHADGAVVRALALPLPDGGTGTPPFAVARPGSPGDAGRADGGGPAVLDLPLVPYHRWAERGPSTMRVFVPTTSREESR